MSKLNCILHNRKTIVDEFDEKLGAWDRMIQIRDYEMDWGAFTEYLNDADRRVASFEKAYK